MRPATSLLVLAITATTVATTWSHPSEARAVQCAPVNARDLEMFFDLWDRALATGDPRKVADRYATDAVLLPTLSELPRRNRSEIEAYFVEFLKKHPRGTIDSRTIRIGCNEAFDAGLYTFIVDGPNPGERVAVKARFSFIYEIRNGRWLITHHHSSELPHRSQAHDATNTDRPPIQPVASRDRCTFEPRIGDRTIPPDRDSD